MAAALNEVEETANCLACGKQFTVTRKRTRFCNRGCYAKMTGPKSKSWKNGVTSWPDGRVQIYYPGHPRANKSGYVFRSLIVAEKALGRPIPTSVEVHHANLIKSDDSNSNLVICQDRSYHAFIHARTRIFLAGGNPNTDKICSTCKKVLPKDNFGFDRNNLRFDCKRCHSASERNRNVSSRT